MSTLHPMFTVPVYSPSMKFNKTPYDQSRGFAVYTLKKEGEEESRPESQRNEYKPISVLKSPKNVQLEEEQAAPQEPAPAQEMKSPSSAAQSRLRGKLTKDVELAETLNSDSPTLYREVQTEVQSTMAKSNVTSPVRKFNPSQTLHGFRYAPPSSTMRPGSRMAKTGTDFIKSRAKSSALAHTLFYDSRIKSIPKTGMKNKVVEELLGNEDKIMANKALLESIIKLRDMSLLKAKGPDFNRYKGVGKIDYVYNDFHTRSTNPGYSRNHGGLFYYR